MSSLTVLPWVMRPSFGNPNIPNQIILPFPKHTPETKGRFFIFGIAVPESQLLGYYGGPEHRRLYRNKVDMDKPKSFKLFSVTRLLRSITKSNVTLDLCFPKGMGPTSEALQNAVVVVTLCNTYRESYMHRPTEEQVQRLERFLACGPPDWYLDTKTADWY
ncbi:hypothetical protein H0H93_005299 [Arthromyces matolae]|nr:hypothetical protein H0H93_005299 [Arthromyces matolae]